MSDFKRFRNAVQKNIDSMFNQGFVFEADVTKDELWDIYLSSFAQGTNDLYISRTEHDCNCCKTFIRSIGNMVRIENDTITTIWDDIDEGIYTPVAKALSELVKSKAIASQFLSGSHQLGNDFTVQNTLDGDQIKWSHFVADVPKVHVVNFRDINAEQNKVKESKDLLMNSLRLISLDALNIVLEFISQNSVYRLEEQKRLVTDFKTIKTAYDNSDNKEYFLWQEALSRTQMVGRIKNTVVGTLLVDITKGIDLEDAVAMYESKVAPQNYKRPTALVTKRMITNAQDTARELGLIDSLSRRYAVTDDITINNVIYADKSVKIALDAFDELSDNVPETIKQFDKVEHVSIDRFIAEIMPTASKVEMLVENDHISNLVSLVAPINKDSKHLFNWDNNFSLSYNGEVADSMKDRVKAAGGQVDAELRFSIMWNDLDTHNRNDLDAHCLQPNNNLIDFSRKTDKSTSGKLDVDIMTPNAGEPAVENIRWTNRSKMTKGTYLMRVHNYAQRGGSDGFRAQIEFDGNVHDFDYRQAIRGKSYVDVANVVFDGVNFTIEPLIDSKQSARMEWNVNTQTFVKVNMIMNSPNFWDDANASGNKHWLFMLDDCINPDETRGFYNEFLRPELHEHRKVFEILSSRMKTEKSNDQLSGLGFSSTQKNSIKCRVTGSMSRIVEINF